MMTLNFTLHLHQLKNQHDAVLQGKTETEGWQLSQGRVVKSEESAIA